MCTSLYHIYAKFSGTYWDPWDIRARSLVIFPDSTAPIQAASSFSVKSKSRSLPSSLALLTRQNQKSIMYLLGAVESEGFSNCNNIPVRKPSCPSKDRGYAVCAGFATFLVNSVMTRNCSMGSFCFNCFSIRAYLHEFIVWYVNNEDSQIKMGEKKKKKDQK